MKFGNIIPILRSFDELKAKEFYIDFLGFKLDWEHRFKEGLPLYMQVSRDHCILHITEHHGDCSPGSQIRIETDNLESYQKLLRDKGYKYAAPEIQEMPWGGDMTISDPFGSRITFTGTASA